MKIILVVVMSLDGKTTKNNETDIYHWSSHEDQEYFFKMINTSKLLIMGRKTYDHAKDLIQHKKGRVRVVLTSNPEKYKKHHLPNVLEFSNVTPTKLVASLKERGYEEAILLGGATTNTKFAEEKLIDEVWLTVEPYLFGKGNAVFDNVFVDLTLRMISIKQLNPQGTLLLKYNVIK